MKVVSMLQDVFSLPIKKPKKVGTLEGICLFLLALCPLFQHYDGFLRDASTSLLLVLFVYFGIRLLCVKEWRFGVVIPLFIFSFYEIFNHGIGALKIGRELLLMGYFVAASSRAINLRQFARIAIRIASIACGLIILQYVCYYILGFHLQLVPTALLSEDAEQWVKLAQTGIISVTGKTMRFYRPSAFFLEPSHFALYCFAPLVLVVLSSKMSRKYLPTAILLSLGILLSTSGMGIALVVGTWGIYFLNKLMGTGTLKERMKKLLTPRNLLVIGVALICMIVLYFAVPLVKMSVNRIFVGTDGGKSAIMGRMGTGIKAVESLLDKGIQFWLGRNDWGNVHKWNMAGFFYTFFTQGLVGMLLSYGFYISSIFQTSKDRVWLCLCIIALSFVTVHTHAAFFMLYYVLLILGGYKLENSPLKMKNFLYAKLFDSNQPVSRRRTPGKFERRDS